MSLAIKDLISAATTHVAESGYFEQVNEHEPKSSPGNGLTAAVWVQDIKPIPALSGLNTTTVRVVLNLRLFTNMLSEPQDAIDPNMVEALDWVLGAYTGDFTLGGLIRNIDLLGAHGLALEAEAGYVKQDKGLFRVYTVTIPLLVNDLWIQEP